jgi:hypothetical protein
LADLARTGARFINHARRCRMFAQAGQSIVVAGERRQHMGRIVERHGERALQVGVQRLDLRG